jgi:hypothetical protein
VKPLNTPASAAAPRNVCRIFAHHRFLKVQRTGIFIFKMLRCAAPFVLFGWFVSTNITGGLHLAFLTESHVIPKKGFNFLKVETFIIPLPR